MVKLRPTYRRHDGTVFFVLPEIMIDWNFIESFQFVCVSIVSRLFFRKDSTITGIFIILVNEWPIVQESLITEAFSCLRQFALVMTSGQRDESHRRTVADDVG